MDFYRVKAAYFMSVETLGGLLGGFIVLVALWAILTTFVATFLRLVAAKPSSDDGAVQNDPEREMPDPRPQAGRMEKEW